METIKLLVIRLIYGRFSHTFQNFVSRSNRPNIANKRYLQPCAKLDALNHYKVAEQPLDDLAEFQTEKKIEFQNTNFGVTFRKVLRNRKRFSCYDIHQYQDVYWRRLGYRERIFNTGMRLIYHFIDNRFFFGEMFFSDSSKVNIELVALSLLKKYTDQKSLPEKNFRIVGKNAFIFFEHTGINLSIKYIDNSDPVINETLKRIRDYSPFTKAEITSDLEDLL